MNIEHREKELSPEFIPINDISIDIKNCFKDKTWKNIPIEEPTTEDPKYLDVVPNISFPGSVMAWPAYYKTVKNNNK